MARNHIYSHLSDEDYFYERCQILGKPWGLPAGTPLENIGDYESAEIGFEVEEMTTDRADTLLSVTAREDVIKVTGTLTAALKQQSDFLRRISAFSTEKLFTQAVVAAGSLPVLDLKPGAIYETGSRDITDVSIETAVLDENEDPIVLTILDKHLNVDPETGRVEVLQLPDGFTGGPGTLKYKAPAIAEAAKRREWSLLSGRGEFWRIVVRQMHKGGRDFIIPKVKLRMEGSLMLGKSENAFSATTITGKIIGDVTEPAGREYGYAADY